MALIDNQMNSANETQQPDVAEQPAQKGPFASQGQQFIKAVYEKINPKDKGSLDRIVKAGSQIMFSKDTHKYMLQALEGEGDMSEKIGMGIVQLMTILYEQSKKSMPLQLMMPAASIFVELACEYVDKEQGGMTMDIFSEALQLVGVGLHRMLSGKIGNEQSGTQPQGTQPPGSQQNAQAGLINNQAQGVPQGGM